MTAPDTLRILVSVTEQTNYGDHWLKFHSEILTFNLADGGLRRLSYDGRENLAICGQIDMSHARHNGYATDFYGMDFEVRDLYAAGLREMERIIKAMRLIQGRMDRLAVRNGRPVDTAGHMVALAHGIGATTRTPFLRRVGASQGHLMSDSEYRAMSADDLRYWVKGEIRSWIDKLGLVSEGAA